MNLQLKKVHYSASLSEETNAFTADLWVDGKKVAFVRNDGRGGCTDYSPYDKRNWEVIKLAEAYCKNLPPVKYGKHSLDMNLEFKIDSLLQEWLDKKDFAKVLVYKTKEGVKMECKWKGFTITKLLKIPQGITTIQKKVSQLQSEGCEILNTNLKGINL